MYISRYISYNWIRLYSWCSRLPTWRQLRKKVLFYFQVLRFKVHTLYIHVDLLKFTWMVRVNFFLITRMWNEASSFTWHTWHMYMYTVHGTCVDICTLYMYLVCIDKKIINSLFCCFSFFFLLTATGYLYDLTTSVWCVLVLVWWLKKKTFVPKKVHVSCIM